DARGADRPDPGRRRAHAGRRVAVNRCGQRTTGIEPESVMKQYLLSVYQPDGEPPPPEILEGIMRDVYAVQQQMKDAGAWVFTAGLHAASSSTVVRVASGQALITDGPFAEGKEHIG